MAGYTRIEQVTIEKAVAEGHCLVHVNNKPVFVQHAAPGDVADLVVIGKKKGVKFAKIEHLHVEGADRTTPRCEHYGLCGGCKWQHMNYDAQLAFKFNQVKEAFERIGQLSIKEIKPILGSEYIFEYRNRLDFGFSHQRYLETHEMSKVHDAASLAGVGFHVPGRFDKILDVKTCHLQADLQNEIRRFCKAKALELDMPFYNLRNHEGLMRSLLVRNSTLGEWMVVVVFAYEDERNLRLMQMLADQFQQITSLQYVINQKKNETLFDQDFHCFKGKDHLLEQLGELVFKIGPKSFFQTNSKQAEVLYKVTKDFAGLSGNEVVYDLYTGTGSIALFVSDGASKVVGVEYVAQAVEDAYANAKLNDISHVSFFAGDMKEVLNDEFIALHGKPDVIITDPPRAGMHEDVVNKMLEIGAQKVVYVSCNPATQARDLKLLCTKYQITAIQPVDMFPHTHHVENVVLLTLKYD